VLGTEPEQAGRMTTKYQVAAGDTLHSLALRHYGDARMTPVISAANHVPDTFRLTIGREIRIPFLTECRTIGVGETLFDLAEMYYGNGAMFPIVSAANHIPHPYLIYPGDSLLIPDLVNVGKHVVVSGETLEELAMRWYNDERCYPVISYANHLADTDDIEVGQVLLRPGLNRRHTVQRGETLSQLGRRWYRDASLGRLIAAANHLPADPPPPVGRVLLFPDVSDW
jgi:nucleoid-associated protein YgaU